MRRLFFALMGILFSAQALAGSPAINIPLSTEAGKIYLPCQFDAYQTQCLLDSGSSFSTVSAPFFNHYPVVGKIYYNGGSGREIASDKIVIHELKLGGFSKEDWPVGRLPQRVGAYNLVGLDLLSDTPLLIDLRHFKLLMNAPAPQTLYSLKIDLGMISIPVKIGELALQAVWDSGASTTVIDQAYIDKHPDDFIYLKAVEGNDASGTRLAMKRYQIKQLQIGKVLIEGLAVVAMDFSGMRRVHPQFPVLFLGYNLLVDHSWYFDFRHYRWRMD